MQENEQIHQINEIDEVQSRHIALWPCRLLVVAFFCSFLACLVALWFSGTLLSAPDHLLPASFLQFIAAHRLPILIVPALCLTTCYGALCFLTREVMVVRERFLDERQKMLRDQAYHSAFKAIKLACLLIPCAFLLPHLPWFNSPSHTSTPVATSHTTSYILIPAPDATPRSILIYILGQAQPHSPTITPVIAPTTIAEAILAGGLLLLCLLIIASALPMAMLAWKGKCA